MELLRDPSSQIIPRTGNVDRSRQSLKMDLLLSPRRRTLVQALGAVTLLTACGEQRWAHQRGGVVFPYQPVAAMDEWGMKSKEFRFWWVRAIAGGVLFAAWAFVNLLFAVPKWEGDGAGDEPPRAADAKRGVPDDPVYPQRSMSWADALLPYWVPMHGGDYLVIPKVGSSVAKLHAARALCDQQLATQLHFDSPFALLSEATARQMNQLLADSRGRTYAIFKLEPDFAQALRIRGLEHEAATPAPKSGEKKCSRI